MTATAHHPALLAGESAWDRGDLIRWLVCGAIVVLAHAGIVATLIEWRAPPEVGEVGTDAIIVEFQPEQIQTEPTPPVEKTEEKEQPPRVQQSEAMLPPKPEVRPEPPREETPPTPPQPTRARANTATWQSQVMNLLEHNKRYPPEARARGEHGTAKFAFRIDGDGHLMSSRIVASSGSAPLARNQPTIRPIQSVLWGVVREVRYLGPDERMQLSNLADPITGDLVSPLRKVQPLFREAEETSFVAGGPCPTGELERLRCAPSVLVFLGHGAPFPKIGNLPTRRINAGSRHPFPPNVRLPT
jgi:periplasmic protein TonB